MSKLRELDERHRRRRRCRTRSSRTPAATLLRADLRVIAASESGSRAGRRSPDDIDGRVHRRDATRPSSDVATSTNTRVRKNRWLDRRSSAYDFDAIMTARFDLRAPQHAAESRRGAGWSRASETRHGRGQRRVDGRRGHVDCDRRGDSDTNAIVEGLSIGGTATSRGWVRGGAGDGATTPSWRSPADSRGGESPGCDVDLGRDGRYRCGRAHGGGGRARAGARLHNRA